MNSLSWSQFYILTATGSPPAPFQPLANLPLTIMVGLTGVGKTTALEQLSRAGVPFRLLPNRREITDKIIIAWLQREAGQPSQPVTDRLERFRYTARYRAKFAGGMAHALNQLALKPAQTADPLFFDGLRGLDELQHARLYFPQARFILLDTPDIVRLGRLLKRADRFDAASLPNQAIDGNFMASLKNISGIQAVFSEEQLKQIAGLAQTDQLPVEEILKKISIIVEERRNYDSSKARTYLTSTLPPEQVLVIDTAFQPASAVASRIANWLKSRQT